MNYLGSKKGVARYVRNILHTLKPGSALTMTIARGPSEDSSAFSVIEELSGAIEKSLEQNYSKLLTNT